MNILCVNKPLGLTPLQAIFKLKHKFPEYKDEKISYAGRLDPMAEGLLLLLIGEENKKRKEYEEMEKEYEFEVLFGAASDSYDILGLVSNTQNDSNREIGNKVIEHLTDFTGRQIQAFPPYSSKPVNGKPLYKWAREDRLSEIKIPTRNIEIKKLRNLDTYFIDDMKLKKTISSRIKLVIGDFRQEKILESWDRFFERNKQTEFCVMKFSAVVSSGTYIRSIAKKMGEKIGTASLALSINRVRVGNFDASQALKLD